MVPRFDDFSEADVDELVSLYHLARTRLSVDGRVSRYDRLCWAANTFCRERPDVRPIRAYKELCSALEHTIIGEA